MARGEKNWTLFLGMAAFAYNTKIHDSTNVSPFEVFLGRAARLPIDLILPLPQQGYQSEAAYMAETVNCFQWIYNLVRKGTSARFKRNTKGYTGQLEQYAEGDLVWCFTVRSVEGKSQKLTDPWIGPFQVYSVLSGALVTIKLVHIDGAPTVVHKSRLRRFKGDKSCQKNRPVVKDLPDNMGDELAEEVGDVVIPPMMPMTDKAIPVQV